MKSLIINTFLILFCYLPSFGQYAVKGYLQDELGQPAVGASIELDRKHFCISDQNGFFTLKTQKEQNCPLTISYLGYETVQISIDPSTWNIDTIIQLNPLIEEVEAIEVLAQRLEDQNVHNIRIDEEYFNKNREGTFAKSLEKIPGINTLNTGVGISKPVIRGFTGQRIVVAQNGVKQEGQQWGNDHGLEIDPFSIESVNIVKGAASLRYGSDAAGGAIEILPSKIIPKNTFQAQLTGQYKTNNQHGATSFFTKMRWDKMMVYGQASYQSFADYRVAADSFIYNTYKLPIYNQRLRNTSGEEFSFRIGNAYIKEQSIQRIEISYYDFQGGIFRGAVGIPRIYNITDDGDWRDIDLPSQKVQHLKAIWNSYLDFGAGNLRSTIGYQYNRRREYSRPHAHNRPVGDFGNTALELRLQTVSWELVYQHHWSEKWQTEWGTNWQYQVNNIGGFEFLIPEFKLWRGGLFGVAYYEPNPRWKWIMGLRLDAGQNDLIAGIVDVYDYDSTIITETRSEAIKATYFNYAASVSAHHTIKPNRWLAYAYFNKTYRIPQPVELGANGVHHGNFRHERGTPDLRPEESYQIEVGNLWKGKKGSSRLEVFTNYFTNYIYLSPSGLFSFLPEAGQLYRYQQHPVFMAGAEWSWDWQFHEQFNVNQSYDYVFNRNITTGLSLPFTPPGSILSQVRWDIPETKSLKKHYLEISHRYAFAQNLVDRNEDKTPAYHLVNISLGGALVFGKQVIHWRFAVDNLLDNPYLNHMSRYRVLTIPEQGRNLIFELRIPFEGHFGAKKEHPHPHYR